MTWLERDFPVLEQVVVFGNSGSGKSTLAHYLAQRHTLVHLDLDTLAYEPDAPGVRRPPESSVAEINAFVRQHERWVIEGCYADLLAEAARAAGQMIFLNPGIRVCQANCRRRPWEPHKYASPEEQDANLDMLLDWVAQYETRDDEFSRSAHERVYDAFSGRKAQYLENLPIP